MKTILLQCWKIVVWEAIIILASTVLGCLILNTQLQFSKFKLVSTFSHLTHSSRLVVKKNHQKTFKIKQKV